MRHRHSLISCAFQDDLQRLANYAEMNSHPCSKSYIDSPQSDHNTSLAHTLGLRLFCMPSTTNGAYFKQPF